MAMVTRSSNSVMKFFSDEIQFMHIDQILFRAFNFSILSESAKTAIFAKKQKQKILFGEKLEIYFKLKWCNLTHPVILAP